MQQACAPWRAAAEAKIQHAHTRRILALLSKSWAAWVERYRQQQVQEQQRKLSDRHRCRHLQALALLAWQAWLAEQHEQQRSVWAALQQWRVWRLSSCLHGWEAWVHAELHIRCRLCRSDFMELTSAALAVVIDTALAW